MLGNLIEWFVVHTTIFFCLNSIGITKKWQTHSLEFLKIWIRQSGIPRERHTGCSV